MNSRTLIAALAGTATLALAGCAGTSAGTAAPTARSSSDSSASAFVACLTSAGVDAKLGVTGLVLVKYALAGDLSTQPDDTGLLGTEQAPDGTTWVAAANSDAFSGDAATQHAYATCEQQHPEFTQSPPSLTDQPDLADQQQAALAFAQCARKNGFSQIADPGAKGLDGVITVPASLSESDFRSLVGACYKVEDSFGIAADPGLTYDPLAVIVDYFTDK